MKINLEEFLVGVAIMFGALLALMLIGAILMITDGWALGVVAIIAAGGYTIAVFKKHVRGSQ
jgi:hypothetical protein